LIPQFSYCEQSWNINTGIQVSLMHMPLDICSAVVRWDHNVSLILVFWETSIITSLLAILDYILTNSIRITFSSFFTNICCLFSNEGQSDILNFSVMIYLTFRLRMLNIYTCIANHLNPFFQELCVQFFFPLK
jgi:hypothetical protein